MRLIPLLLVFALLAPAPVLAQQTIRPGDEVQGELSADDPTLTDGSHYDLWRFRAQAGRTYLVYLYSSDFDAFAAVGPRVVPVCGADCVEGDDDAGGTNALVQFVPPETGTYLIRAGSFFPGSTGAYTLTLEDHGEVTEDTVVTTTTTDTMAVPWVTPMPDGATDTIQSLQSGIPLEGVRVPGRLTFDGEPYDTWTYYGGMGETIRVTAESEEFDTVLRIRLLGSSGWELLGSDDDGGAGTNSAMDLTLPHEGSYLVEAGSWRDQGGGRYTLLLTSQGAGVVDTGTVWPTNSAAAGSLDAWQAIASITAPADTTQVGPEPILAGEQRLGQLAEGDRQAAVGYTLFDLWSYVARAGETVTLRMRSDDFDTELHVGWGPHGTWEALGSDDDGGDGTNSELTVTFPSDGEYHILARALFPGDTGVYTLSVERH
jgi:hypothetical protein